MDHCDLCGRDVQIGDWPYCPHPHGNNLQKPIEPHTDEMLGGGEFRTISEKVKYMDAHAIVPRGEARPDRSDTYLRQSDIRNAIRETFQELRG